jgi:hypothetical protein
VELFKKTEPGLSILAWKSGQGSKEMSKKVSPAWVPLVYKINKRQQQTCGFAVMYRWKISTKMEILKKILLAMRS